jgi:hypothetical protein
MAKVLVVDWDMAQESTIDLTVAVLVFGIRKFQILKGLSHE